MVRIASPQLVNGVDVGEFSTRPIRPDRLIDAGDGGKKPKRAGEIKRGLCRRRDHVTTEWHHLERPPVAGVAANDAAGAPARCRPAGHIDGLWPGIQHVDAVLRCRRRIRDDGAGLKTTRDFVNTHAVALEWGEHEPVIGADKRPGCDLHPGALVQGAPQATIIQRFHPLGTADRVDLGQWAHDSILGSRGARHPRGQCGGGCAPERSRRGGNPVLCKVAAHGVGRARVSGQCCSFVRMLRTDAPPVRRSAAHVGIRQVRADAVRVWTFGG